MYQWSEETHTLHFDTEQEESVNEILYPYEPAQVQSGTDSEATFCEQKPASPWKIIVADSELDIQKTIESALHGFQFGNRSISLLFATSAPEAKQLLVDHTDAALILLDEVMEKTDVSLGMTRYIREEIQNDLLRIILLVGQPSDIPQESIILDYEISDYKTKSELTRERLLTSVATALRAHHNLKELKDSRQALQALATDLCEQNYALGQANQRLQNQVKRQKQIEQKLQVANSQISEEQTANQTKSTFLAHISHEIRTPMNAVMGMASLLLDTQLEEEQRHYARTIYSSSESLLTILNDLLDFAKIESGKLQIIEEPFDLCKCIEDVLDMVAPRAHEKELELIYLPARAIPNLLVGDAMRLRQVLVNLITNAIKFTEEGEIQVTVANKPQGNGCHLIHFSIQDTGIGIAADDVSKLFTSFSQVDDSPTRLYNGAGLGLAISKHVCELMGGSIWVESEEGIGSTFHFTAQLYSGIASKETQKNLLEQDSLFHGKRALIISPNPTMRTVIQELLDRRGMYAKAISMSATFISMSQRQLDFDVVIFDMNIGELAEQIQASQMQALVNQENSPVIFLKTTQKSPSGNDAK